jgi:hypothetical protein
MSDHQLLIVVVPVDIKDDVVDTLIGLEDISGFNLETIAGYSREHSQFNIREQVEGYRQLFRFEIMHKSDQQERLISSLRPVCAGPHLRYWIVPIVEQGHFNDNNDTVLNIST